MKQKQIGGDKPKKKRSKTAAQKQRKKPSWSKLMMVVIIAVCIEIIIYSEIAMWVRYDMSALYALIGVPAAMFGTFWTYCEKSKKENCAGGITYDMAMKDTEKENNGPELNSDEAVG